MVFNRDEKAALRRVRDATAAKDATDVEWRQAIVAARDLGLSLRAIEPYAGTTNTNVGNICRRAAEVKILAEAERKAARAAKKVKK